jgi:HK97 family phage major capsid protein
MSDRLKELRDQQAKLVVDARAKLEEITDDIDESRAKEIESEYDKMMADYDKLDARAKREEELIKRQEAIDKHAAELESVDTSRRPKGDERHVNGAGTEGSEKDRTKAAEAERKAFVNYLRYGMDGLDAEQRSIFASRRNELRTLLGESEARAQGVASSGAGGALVPEGFMAELVTSLKAYGPMNDDGIVRRIETATGNAIPWPTLDDTSNKGSLLSENTQVSTQDVTFGTKTLNAYKYSSDLILVSNELLQDSAIDVESIVRMALAERIGRILNEHFTTADGSSKPNGIVTASSLGVTAASQSAITADELIDLEHSVDPAYRSDPSCRFMFNDATFKLIRKLKDGQGNYLWQPADLRTGSPATLLGYPFSINQDIATGESGESPATQEKTVIFGAMNRYVVRLVLMFAVRRLTERYADYDQVGFVGFTRADGELLDTAAVKHLRQASA